MSIGNLFSGIPAQFSEELIEVLVAQPPVRIERIISKGHASPSGFWYDQPEHEWVIVLQGEALLQLEGETEPVRLRPGSYINLPAHVKHRVEWTDPHVETVWLAVFY